MAKLTINVPSPLEPVIAERVKALGAASAEDYLLGLLESDCEAGALERILKERMDGPFVPLESDWKDRVRRIAADRAGG
jgi:hypothetical protein